MVLYLLYLVGYLPYLLWRLWWQYQSILFHRSLRITSVMKRDNLDGTNSKNIATKECPFCAEIIKQQAIMCRFCNRELDRKHSSDESDMGTSTQKHTDASSQS